MKLAVCVKHALDESELRTNAGGPTVLEGAPGKMGTFDKNAVEEAIRLKASAGGDVTVFIVGPAEAMKTMREALAMGADRGVLVLADAKQLDSFSVSRLLSKALQKSGQFDLVVCSEGSSDIYTGQVPPALAELAGMQYVGYVRKLSVAGGTATAERSLEDSVEIVETPLPAVASVVSEINEPRYPTLIQIMQAAKKPVEQLTPAQLGVDTTPLVIVRSLSGQSSSRKKVMIEGSPEEVAKKLVDALGSEGVLPS